MCDLLLEDIVAAVETLMVADVVDIEAFAHPDAKLSLNDKVGLAAVGATLHHGHAKREKARKFKNSMQEQKESGVFKRGSC
jgi:hypothetical protein